jgi:hypothetical protein
LRFTALVTTFIGWLSNWSRSALNQRSHALGDLSPDSLNVIANSRMDAKHDHLNDLLDG